MPFREQQAGLAVRDPEAHLKFTDPIREPLMGCCPHRQLRRNCLAVKIDRESLVTLKVAPAGVHLVDFLQFYRDRRHLPGHVRRHSRPQGFHPFPEMAQRFPGDACRRNIRYECRSIQGNGDGILQHNSRHQVSDHYGG